MVSCGYHCKNVLEPGFLGQSPFGHRTKVGTPHEMNAPGTNGKMLEDATPKEKHLQIPIEPARDDEDDDFGSILESDHGDIGFQTRQVSHHASYTVEKRTVSVEFSQQKWSELDMCASHDRFSTVAASS